MFLSSLFTGISGDKSQPFITSNKRIHCCILLASKELGSFTPKFHMDTEIDNLEKVLLMEGIPVPTTWDGAETL